MEDEELELENKPMVAKIGRVKREGRFRDMVRASVDWFRMLSEQMHWSFLFGVVAVYGINQGLGGGLGHVGSDYYWKDVQKVEPSMAQFYSGISSIPWIVKPLWGLLTDVLPIAGYSRRPYFIIAGCIDATSMLLVGLHNKLHVLFALLSLTGGSAGVAIADVTIDACVAQNSISHSSLTADMQSLCGLSSSIIALMEFSISGFLVHLIGPKGVLGLLSISFTLVFLVGTILKEPHVHNFAYK